MNTAPEPNADREARLNAALLACLEAVQQSPTGDRRAVLARYPEFADELREFFALREQIDRLAAPLREAALSSAGVALQAPPATELGRIGEFQLLREIGRGGMGVVYEAHQTSLNRRVALKVLPFAAALDPKQLQRFQNEAQAAAQLHHTNIVPVFAVGHERGVHYYAMQLIEGQSLAALIEDLRRQERLTGDEQPATSGAKHPSAQDTDATGPYCPLPPAEPRGKETAVAHAASISTDRSTGRAVYFRRVAQLGQKAAEALEHAHQAGVIHRDIKPANLLVDARGNLWITDFGLALFQTGAGLTMTGELLGTLRYMSPEQAWARRGEVDHRTDIYSLGVTLYELLTLRPVFDGQDRQELLTQIARVEPTEPRRIDRAIPVELETIVLKAIAKSPTERYATAQEMADDLQRFLDDKPILAKRPSLRERAVKWARRHRSVVASAVVLMALTMIGSVASTVVIAYEHAETKKAYEREQERAQEAAEQRAKAEASFQQARRAVDYFYTVSAEELPNWPQLTEIRAKLLRTALAYYQEFIDQHADDPSLRQELTDSLDRVTNLLSKLENMPGGRLFIQQTCNQLGQIAQKHPLNRNLRDGYLKVQRIHFLHLADGGTLLLLQKAVADELKLTDDQRKEAALLISRLNDQKQQISDQFFQLPADQQRQRRDEMVSSNRTAVAQILQPAQVKRLKEIDWQVQGAIAFDNPEVVKALALNDGQREQIRTTLHVECKPPLEFRDSHRSRSPGPPPEDARRATLTKVLSVLTDDQKTKWKALTGEPFTAPLHFGPPAQSPRR